MKNEERIVELLAESLKRYDQMAQSLGGMVQRMDGMVQLQDETLKEVRDLNKRVGRLEKQQMKTNMWLQSHDQTLIKISKILEGDVPRFGEVIRTEQLGDDPIILKKVS